MQIISHRGYWKTTEEKNTKKAFQRSFAAGFGLETDLRDFNGEIVISHDMPLAVEMTLENFFDLCLSAFSEQSLPLALNIKSDGLQKKLLTAIKKYDIQNYFIFDMSFPDLKISLEAGLNVFGRLSEFEHDLPFYENLKGIWLDTFNGVWFEKKDILNHHNAGKTIAIVSGELHNRPYKQEWEIIKNMGIHQLESILLCTDFPEEAKTFFHYV